MICNEPDVLDGFLTSTVGSIHRNKSTPGFMSSFLPGFYSGRRNGSKKNRTRRHVKSVPKLGSNEEKTTWQLINPTRSLSWNGKHRENLTLNMLKNEMNLKPEGREYFKFHCKKANGREEWCWEAKATGREEWCKKSNGREGSLKGYKG